MYAIFFLDIMNFCLHNTFSTKMRTTITDIYNIDHIKTVYRYLEYTTIAKAADKKIMSDASDSIRAGKPLTAETEKQLKDLFCLYNGLTID